MALKIVEINPDIRADVEANDGYCPCAIWHNPDTKCMCREFREQAEPGECHCGRMAAIRLETDNVRRILLELLNGMEYFEPNDKEAEKSLCYIAGATDMANGVIKAIKELGGK